MREIKSDTSGSDEGASPVRGKTDASSKSKSKTSSPQIVDLKERRPSKDRRDNPSGGGYVPEEADRTVRPNEILKDERFWQVARTLTTFVAGSISDRYGQVREMPVSQKKQRKAKRIRETLVELGPTFVKLGQFLSVRRDILPAEMADELSLLQDKVPPFDFKVVASIIERELGQPPESLFARFENEPVASASIGQVHRAVLKDGTQVVVKVQRPGLATRFYQDLGYMRLVTRLGSVLKPQGEWDGWLKLSDEFGRTLFSEINYLQEGKNANQIRQFLKDHPDIRVPRVFWKYTGKRVLTLEYIPGIKVDRTQELIDSGLDVVSIGNKLVTCYLDQVLLHGFFHADPHAGNLAIDDHGNVVLYDFGMIGRITEKQRKAITGCIASVIKKDASELVRHLTDLEIVRPEANPEAVRRALTPFIDYYAGKGIRDLDFSTVENDLEEVVGERAIRMPPTLAYLMRTGTSLEGIARTLHPNFSFVEAAKPSLKKWILNRPEQAAQVLKLMGSESQMSIRAAWQKLISSTNPGRSLTFLDSTTTATEDVEESVAEQLDNMDAQGDGSQEMINDLNLLKNRVYDLEEQLEEAKQNRVNLLVQTLWFLSFAILYLGTSLIPAYHDYAKFFLIGNVVLVAKILGHLVRSYKLLGRSGRDDPTRRLRR